jgi:hypothetical protein
MLRAIGLAFPMALPPVGREMMGGPGRDSLLCVGFEEFAGPFETFRADEVSPDESGFNVMFALLF